MDFSVANLPVVTGCKPITILSINTQRSLSSNLTIKDFAEISFTTEMAPFSSASASSSNFEFVRFFGSTSSGENSRRVPGESLSWGCEISDSIFIDWTFSIFSKTMRMKESFFGVGPQ